MKWFEMRLKKAALGGLSLAAMALLFTGCSTTADPKFSSTPDFSANDDAKLTPVGGTTTSPIPPATNKKSNWDIFHPGDQLTVMFGGIDPVPQPQIERITEDGTITLPLIGAVQAAGKTQGQLQKEIRDAYVPKFYVRLTVTVQWSDRYYFVSGEVKGPGRQQYAGSTTVTKAIASAGDFTDWANKKKVKLTRADGTSTDINALKAIEDPALDLPVFPGDKVYVPRKSPWSP